MYQPKSIYTQLALETIQHYLKNGHLKKFPEEKIPEALKNMQAGCFVSLHKLGGELRGCIGTIEPLEKNLADEIQRNAISAAFRDSRFSSLQSSEMDEIELSVDVLTLPERVYSLDELDPMIYGVIVSDGNYNRAVLLPSLPGIETLDKQLDIVIRKAGLGHKNIEELEVYRFTSTRYH